MIGFLLISGRAILNPPKSHCVAPLERMDGEPVFDEPWQAQALAIADALINQGVITPVLWSATLGEELQNTQARDGPDNITTYYEAVLRSLERLTERYR